MSDTEPAYATTPERYAHQRGIDRPYICEISPTQYALMSKRRQREYDAKRRRDWDGWADAVAAWKMEIIAAWEAGEIREEELHDDARDVIKRYQRERESEATKRAAADILDRWVKALASTPIKAGDAIVHSIYGEGVATKVNRKTIRVRFHNGSELKCDRRQVSHKDQGEFAYVVALNTDRETVRKIAWHIKTRRDNLGFSQWQIAAINEL